MNIFADRKPQRLEFDDLRHGELVKQRKNATDDHPNDPYAKPEWHLRPNVVSHYCDRRIRREYDEDKKPGLARWNRYTKDS